MLQQNHITRGVLTLDGTDGVTALASAGERRFLVGTANGTLHLWNALGSDGELRECAVRIDPEPITTCMLGIRSISCGGFNGRTGAVTSLDGDLFCFQLPEPSTTTADADAAAENGVPKALVSHTESLPGESMAVASCRTSSSLVAVGAHGTVRIVDGITAMASETLKLESSTGSEAQKRQDTAKERRKVPPTALSVDIDCEDERALVGVDDGSLAIVDIKTAKLLHTDRNCHRDTVRCVAFARHTPSEVVTSGNDQLISVYDTRTQSVTATVRGHTGPVTCASFSQSGAYFATGATDRTVRVWDRRKMEMIFRSRAHKDSVLDVEYLLDGVGLVSCSEDSTLAVHDCTTSR